MELLSIPITEFYSKCLESAKDRGYKWVVSLIAREADSITLYDNLMTSWYSINSITGPHFLFVFAGKENTSDDECWDSGISDHITHYVALVNKFVTIFPHQDRLKCYVPYNWRQDKQGYMGKLRESHTDAINSLKRFFHISEQEIPCLLFTSLYQNKSYVVRINQHSDNLYGYFKRIVNKIAPSLDVLTTQETAKEVLTQRQKQLCEEMNDFPKTKEDILISLYEELNEIAHQSKNQELIRCITDRCYGRFPQPLRGKLNKFIDMSKDYERRCHKTFNYDEVLASRCNILRRKSEITHELARIESEIADTDRLFHDTIHSIDSTLRRSAMSDQSPKAKHIQITVTGNNNQINTACDSATVIATQNNCIDADSLSHLIEAVRSATPNDIPKEEASAIDESLDAIESELVSKKPRHSLINTALKTLRGIAGTAEFLAAIAALAEFIQSLS